MKVGENTDQSDLEVAEYYWFPMLAGLSDLTSDPRTEVRNCALEVLFDLLKERGKNFSGHFWESVFHRVLFPIFDYVRHAGKDGEKPASPINGSEKRAYTPYNFYVTSSVVSTRCSSESAFAGLSCSSAVFGLYLLLNILITMVTCSQKT